MEKERFRCDIPIVIPSLRRMHPLKPKKAPILCLVSCLRDLFKNYDATNVHVIGQEYTEEEKSSMIAEFPQVTFHWYERRMGIIGTFNKVKALGCELGPWYVHYDDDVEVSNQFGDNPTLLAFESVMSTAPDRVGVVTCTSTSLIHFAKQSRNLIKVVGNPAQLLLINSAAAKQCEYDSRFECFKSDTDFTMQIAHKGFIPVSISKYFSFAHTIPLSQIVVDEVTGRKSFQNYDNITSGKSIGGTRTPERRAYEFSQLNEKWPLIRTAKNFKFQVLKGSIVHLTGFREAELLDLEAGFDYSLVKNIYEGYYKKDHIVNSLTPDISLF
jgi:hypothetical protein